MRRVVVVAACVGLLGLASSTAEAFPSDRVTLVDKNSDFDLIENAGSPTTFTLWTDHAYAGLTAGQFVNGMGAERCFGSADQVQSTGDSTVYRVSLYCAWEVPSEPPPPVEPTRGIIPNNYWESVTLTVGALTWSASGVIGGSGGWPGADVLTESCQGDVGNSSGTTFLTGPCTLTD